MAEILQKNDLESLNSNLFYYKLDKGWGKCDSFASSSDIEEEINNYFRDEKVPVNLVKALCYVAEMTHDKYGYNERCDYLYYWLSDTLFKNLTNDSNFPQIIDILYSGLREIDNETECKYIFPEISKEVLEKLKTIYDYSQNFSTIISHLNTHSNKCSRDYYDYLQNAVTTYNDVYNNCTGTSKEFYCSRYDSIFDEQQYKNLSKLTYTLVEDIPVSDSRANPGVIQHQQQLESSLIITKLDPIHPSLVSGSTDKSSKTFMFIVFPLIAILLFFFLVYKFTPVVPLLRRFLLKKKLIRSNLEDAGTDDIMDRINETQQADFERRLFNVSYNSPGNSFLL
ncbi:PIR Superfamily Protein [Plasmodium ovale curtisi]|uniref:PIR Superfamily Protein n=1 Tax=Plasmodium ovale curtisi TaxID=864141 RepID=A0A1A8WGQ2_PLAOA|nr:PIR Superfamily Protein [Plasmodium ovale curtisi]SBS99050.1 PIR Superfamily Protein [Plasmodium ovale curtisi]